MANRLSGRYSFWEIQMILFDNPLANNLPCLTLPFPFFPLFLNNFKGQPF